MNFARRFLFLLLLALAGTTSLIAQVSVGFYSDGGDGFVHNGFVLSSTPPMVNNSNSVFFDGTFSSYYKPTVGNPTLQNQPVSLQSRVYLFNAAGGTYSQNITLVISNPAEGGTAEGYNPNPGQAYSTLYAPVNPLNQVRWVITGLHPDDPTKRYDSLTFAPNPSGTEGNLTLASYINPVSGDITITATNWTNFSDPSDPTYFGGFVNFNGYFTTADLSTIPEPASLPLALSLSVGGLVWWSRRRSR
jgi:hypothetical protein